MVLFRPMILADSLGRGLSQWYGIGRLFVLSPIHGDPQQQRRSVKLNEQYTSSGERFQQIPKRDPDLWFRR
jgi:hypothetical protein